MDTIELHPDFKDFLRSLNSNGVKYLLIGGYAVGYHGYPRATADMDIWIAVDEFNAKRIVQALSEFGMPTDDFDVTTFLKPNKIIRLGSPPVRIELLTGISGVDFDNCYNECEIIESDGIPIKVISYRMLKVNKKASGRLKDLDDLEHLP